MKIYTGIDIVYLPRFEKLLEDSAFVERVFTIHEVEDSRVEHLAGLFVVKEAFFKATQIEIRKWHEVEVINGKNGKPTVKFDQHLIEFNIESLDVSISHDQDYVVGSVVIIS